MSDLDEMFKMFVLALQARLGRMPTEDEVVEFVMGDEDKRKEIWNHV